MAEVYDLEGAGPDVLAAAVDAAAEAVAEGALVVLPTDTVYGIGARPDLPAATARLFEAKRRPRGLTLPVLVAHVADAGRVGVLDDRARAVAESFWPGGLTLVLPRAEALAGWELGEERDTVGLRVPDHPVALALLERTGPLAATSANRSGEPTPPECGAVREVFGDTVAVYLCHGPAPGGTPSTVVDLAGAEPRVLREGAVPAASALAALRAGRPPAPQG